MTRQEVENLIGKRASDFDTSNGPTKPICEQQTNDGAAKIWDFAWFNALVCYGADGKVDHTEQLWQQD